MNIQVSSLVPRRNSLAGECAAVHNAAVNRAQQKELIERLRAATAKRGMKQRASIGMEISPQRFSDILERPDANFTRKTLEKIERWLATLTSPVPGVEHHQGQPPREEEPPMPSPSSPGSPAHFSLYWLLVADLTPEEARAFRAPLEECLGRFHANQRGSARERKSPGT